MNCLKLSTAFKSSLNWSQNYYLCAFFCHFPSSPRAGQKSFTKFWSLFGQWSFKTFSFAFKKWFHTYKYGTVSYKTRFFVFPPPLPIGDPLVKIVCTRRSKFLTHSLHFAPEIRHKSIITQNRAEVKVVLSILKTETFISKDTNVKRIYLKS